MGDVEERVRELEAKQSPLYNKFVLWLLGVVAMLISSAFLAWAGVVWDSNATVRQGIATLKEDRSEYIISLEARLTGIAKDVEFTKDQLVLLREELHQHTVQSLSSK